MSFCSGVEDNLLISIGNEFNDERIIKVYDVLNERLYNYSNELNKLRELNNGKSKNIQKLENKIDLIQKFKSKNLQKFQRYYIKPEINNTIKQPTIKKMKNNFKNNINNTNINQNIRNERNSIKEKVKSMEKQNIMYFPRLNLLTNKDLDIKMIKNIILSQYSKFDGYIKKIKDLRNKSLFNIIFFKNQEDNKDIQLLIKNILKSEDQYVINSNKINLYFEIDKRDINNNYDYLLV